MWGGRGWQLLTDHLKDLSTSLTQLVHSPRGRARVGRLTVAARQGFEDYLLAANLTVTKES